MTYDNTIVADKQHITKQERNDTTRTGGVRVADVGHLQRRRPQSDDIQPIACMDVGSRSATG